MTHLDTGTYTLNLHDYSQLPWRHHNFHLFGPGIDVATDSETIGDETFTIRLVDGTWVGGGLAFDAARRLHLTQTSQGWDHRADL